MVAAICPGFRAAAWFVTGLLTTLWDYVCDASGLITLGLGGLLVKLCCGREPTFAGLAGGYIFILWCTPAYCLAFLFLWHSRVFKVVVGTDINNWSRTVFVIITMILLFAGHDCEVLKAAYLVVPKGQVSDPVYWLDNCADFSADWSATACIALPNLTTAFLTLMRRWPITDWGGGQGAGQNQS